MEAFTELLQKHKIVYTRDDSYVEAGWLPLLDKLFRDLISLQWDRKLFQVKSKFGGLRVYLNHSTKKMNDLVDQAELASMTICELCGQEGEILPVRKSASWLSCRCTSCRTADSAAREARNAESSKKR